MQRINLLLVVCTAVCTLSVRAEDNEAQAKARQEVERKLSELQTLSPEPRPQAAVNPPSLTKPPGDSETISKAREAVRQKVQEGQPHPSLPSPQPAGSVLQPAITVPSAVSNQARAVQLAPLRAPAQATSAPADQPTSEAPPGGDSQATTEFIKALRQQMREMLAQMSMEPAGAKPLPGAEQQKLAARPAAASAPLLAVVTTSTAVWTVEKANPPPISKRNLPAEPKSSKEPSPRTERQSQKPLVVKSSLAFPSLEGPPLPISADKQQSLKDLLQKYLADQITPAEYHARRANILTVQ